MIHSDLDETFSSQWQNGPGDESALSWCALCGSCLREDISFCLACGRRVDAAAKAPLARRGRSPHCRRPAQKLVFARSRRSFDGARRLRRVLLGALSAALVALPYYAICKATMGDSFPANVVAAAQEVDGAISGLDADDVINGRLAVAFGY